MRSVIFFIVSLTLAFCLMVWAPQSAPTAYSPPWVFLALSYWVIQKPKQVGFSLIFIVSVLMDTLTGTLLGVHALVMLVPMFVLMVVRPSRLAVWYQLLLMFVLVLIYQVMLACVHGFMGLSPISYLYWLSPITAALVWMILVMPFNRSRS